MISRLVITLAMASVSVQPAMAQSASCVSSHEISAGLRLLMPALIKTTAQRCAATLSGSAYLNTRAEALAQRFAEQPGDDAALASLLAKVDDKGEFKGLNSIERKAFVGAVVGKELGKEIKPGICPKIDRIVGLFDPMPADNLIGIIEVILREVAASDERKAAKSSKPAPKLMICPEAGTP